MQIDLTIAILIALMFVVMYAFFVYIVTNRNRITQGISSLPLTDKEASTLISPSSTNVTYEMWIFLNGEGAILGRNNEMNVVISNGSTLTVSDTTSAKTCFNDISVENFPKAKWVHLVIQIYQKTCEIYLNGKLLKTAPLKAMLANMAANPLKIGKKHDGSSVFNTGYITKFERFVKPLSTDEIWNKYLQGNGEYNGSLFGILDMLGGRDLWFRIYTDGDLTSQLSLFGSESPSTLQATKTLSTSPITSVTTPKNLQEAATSPRN